NQAVVPTSLGGLQAPGSDVGTAATFVGTEWPNFLPLIMDQSFGSRATYDSKRFSLGATYLQGTVNSSQIPGAAVPPFRRLQVVGGDIRVPLFGKLSAQAEAANSTWDPRVGAGVVNLNGPFARTAVDARLNVPVGKGLFQPFWKTIGA